MTKNTYFLTLGQKIIKYSQIIFGTIQIMYMLIYINKKMHILKILTISQKII